MKKLWLLILVTLCLMLTACAGETSQIAKIRQSGTLRVGVKMDVPHFGYLNPETDVYEGLEIDLAKQIAKAIIGDENAVNFVGVTAQTRGPKLNNGEIDIVVATFTITEERKTSYSFSNPYYTDEIGFLVRKNVNIEAISDINGKIIGITQQSTARDILEVDLPNLGITAEYREFASYPEVIAAIKSGAIDAFVTDKSILYGYVDDETVLLNEGLSQQEYGIAATLANKALIDFVNEQLAKMQNDGTLDVIIAKWAS